MKIIISEIPEEGLDINLDNLTVISEAVVITSPIKGALRVDKAGSEIFVSGHTTAEIELTCSRCLNNFRKEVFLNISLTYHPLSELKGDEVYELHDDEMEIDFYSGDEIDIDSLIEEELILSIPMKPLCSEDCKGICPSCGADLNINSCECPVEVIDERFAILKKLLRKGE